MSELDPTFAFIIHPIDPKRDVSRRFPWLGRRLSEPMIHFFSTFFPPVYLSEVSGITSAATGAQLKGWLIACPLTAARMLQLPERVVYRKIIQTGRLAERLGARILGLGAFTSVVGDGGATVAAALDIPVTTGDAYTVAVTLQAVRQAAAAVGIDLVAATAAIVGANGAIGRTCAEILAGEVARLILVGRRPACLVELGQALLASAPRAQIEVAGSLAAVQAAQVVISVSSAPGALIQPEHLRLGAVVCDVALPRDVSHRVAAARPDVLVIDGGVVEVPGPANFHFDFGLPTGRAFACMAETMALALEGRFEDYTLGKHISPARVSEIEAIAQKHGFHLSGWRSFDRPITDFSSKTGGSNGKSPATDR